MTDVTYGPQHAVVGLVAEAEHFSHGRLLDLDPNIDEFEVSSWEKRRKKWKDRFQVDFEDVSRFHSWPALQAYIEVRNAIQHGLGSLTGQQLLDKRRSKTLSKIGRTSIVLHGAKVIVSDGCVQECKDSCESFVEALDRFAPKP